MTNDIDQQIADLTAAYQAGYLPEAAYQAAVAALRHQAIYAAEAKEGSAIAQDHSFALAAGATLNYYEGEPTDDPFEALQIYRRVLLGSTSTLPLRGVNVGASDPSRAKPLGLANVYIDLDTTEETWDLTRKARGRGGNPVSEAVFDDIDSISTPRIRLQDESVGGQSQAELIRPLPAAKIVPVPALKAAMDQRQLVLTGEPGGGKSTFVNHLAYCLAAHALHPAAGWLDHLPSWPAEEADRLPIVVTLRDFAATLDAGRKKPATPGDLWRFIAARLDDQNLRFAARAVEGQLRNGRAIVLLDGLDEVTGTDRRQQVRDAVAAFAQRYPGNRYLVTCRILSYQPPDDEDQPDLRLDAEQFPVFELAPFDESKIDRFIDAWYAELARIGSARPQDVDPLAAKLKTAVRRPDLWRLAPNPLLLTVMALVHADRGRLPDARALLYDQTVDMLLWRWEEVKLAGSSAAPTLRDLLQQAGRDETDFMRVLWQLAFDAHGRLAAPDNGHTKGEDGNEALADITEAQLTRALLKLKPDDWQWAHEVVGAMKLRAGLLLERSPGVFTFPHRTFQEYLAGAYLSVQSDCDTAAARLAGEGPLWREPILLAAGRLIHVAKDVGKAFTIVQRLCPAAPVEDEAGWRAAWLAGDALREIGLPRARDDSWGAGLLDRVRNRLAELVSTGQLAPRERADAGNTLAELGDPRPGVGVRILAGQAVPDIELCYVPPGPFWMGSPDDDTQAEKNEKPIHRREIRHGYWIGRYPTTVAQWREFCSESDYTPRNANSLKGVANHPATWININDAIAFCQWLTELGHNSGWLATSWRAALPSEKEWEKAARGGLRVPSLPLHARIGDALDTAQTPDMVENQIPMRRFPWGDEPAGSIHANSKVAGVGYTSPTGVFPAGKSLYDVYDLSGNVFEWTRSLYQRYYPRDFTDNQLVNFTFTQDRLMILRGGYYRGGSRFLRCAYRRRYGPHVNLEMTGFRIVVLPVLSEES